MTTLSITEFKQLAKKKRVGKQVKSEGHGKIKDTLGWMGVQFVIEHEFHPTRKWRFDFAILDKMIAIEYEGIHSDKSRHTTRSGYAGDIEKYNAATKLGWRILRYHAGNVGEVYGDLETIFNQKQ